MDTARPLTERVLNFLTRQQPLPAVLIEEVCASCRTDVLRFYRYNGLTDEDAEDLTQDVLLRVTRGLPNFRGQAGLRTWVNHIALNRLRTYLEAKRGRPELRISEIGGDAEDGSDALERLREQHRDGQAEEVTARLALVQMLERLTDIQRTTLQLDLEGYSYREIAIVVGRSVPAVAMSLTRARKSLREYFEQEGQPQKP